MPPVAHCSHGLSRFDELKYPPDFKHFDYVNPDAPKGGDVSLFVHGTFDSLNPYSAKGVTPALAPSYNYMRYGFSEFNEPLMVGTGQYSPSGDEIQTAYGLIAKSVEYADDNSWIVFELRPEARFHDGKPITADDVVFSFRELGEKGHPRYRMQLEPVKNVEKLDEHKVRFNFKQTGTRSQLLRVAELPVLPSHYWSKHDISKTTLEPMLHSGPYKITRVKPGVSVTFSRVKDYWGKDLPVNKGRYNFDKITLHFHRDYNMAFESFKAGGHDLHLEVIAKHWNTSYDFAAVREGKIRKRLIPHQMAYGSSFMFFNTRRAPFDDRRVREAISLMFDYEWVNKSIFYSAYKRSASYFPNSPMSSTGVPDKEEMKWLKLAKEQQPPELLTQPFKPSFTSGDGSVRKQQKRALELLKDAGWTLKGNTLIHRETGKPMRFSFLEKGASSETYLTALKKNLATIGIEMTLVRADAAQYIRQLRAHEYDMVERILPQSLAPDSELFDYFHSERADAEGSHNFAGIKQPAIDVLLDKIPQAKSSDELKSLTRSLDRMLLWQHYGIPKWYSDSMRVAHRDVFAWPKTSPVYSTPFSTWWRKDLPAEDKQDVTP
ncbi:ABC transporter substrate-binding protein [Endozoicomonas montiporae]|uniref:ABC transporter substrate-binding protein n=1 Tax=Endozoicomonas montiporae TaxID=1027273 RepID=A0A081NAM4_9GAMM|nr:ABC transporter substrate-binding protein [Endozoicomonas montiporae]